MVAMKKILSLLFTFVAVVMLVSCSNPTSNEASTSEQATENASVSAVSSEEAVSTSEKTDVSSVEDIATSIEEATASEEKNSGGSKLLAAEEWPQTSVTEGVPVPDFGVAPYDVNTSNDSVSVSYDNVEEDAIISFIEEVKAAGLNADIRENSTTTSYRFEASNMSLIDASTNDELYKSISVSYDVFDEKNTVRIQLHQID